MVIVVVIEKLSYETFHIEFHPLRKYLEENLAVSQSKRVWVS